MPARTMMPLLLLLLGSCTAPSQPHEQTTLDFTEVLDAREAELDALGHVGDPRSLRWANLDVHEVGLSCVDGRADAEVVGTPGGDAGELLLLLAAAEAEGRHVDVGEADEWIDAWINEFGGFYMHTDVDAFAELGRALAADPRFEAALAELVNADGSLDLIGLEAWLRSPPEPLREPLLAHLVDPDVVGCGHLRSVLRNPEDYEVRPALAGAVIVGVYRRLWSTPDQVRFVVLHGQHHERAILDVEIEDSHEHAAHEIPLIQPSNAHDQVFVIQPQAVALFRDRAVALFVRRHPDVDAHALRTRVDSLGDVQLDATLVHLNVHVPTVRVVVNHAATRSVAALGSPASSD